MQQRTFSGASTRTPAPSSVRAPSRIATAANLPARQHRNVRVAAGADEEKDQGFLGNLFSKPKGQNLDERIMSGEFTDAGSTKEKMTRPLRKALASDPTGLGKQ